MYRFLTVLFSLFYLLMPISSGVVDDKIETFNNEIKNGYECYYVVDSFSNISYSFKVVLGTYQDEVTSSFILVSENPLEFYINIISNNEYYTIDSDERGDYIAYALPLSKDMQILIVDEEGITRFSESIEYYNDAQEFKEKNLLLEIGENNGLTPTKLKGTNPNLSFTVLILVFVIIIFICLVVLFLFLIFKKGLFNSEKRKQGIPQYTRYYTYNNNVNNNNVNNANKPYVEAEVVDEKIVEENVDKPKNNHVYDRHGNYEEDIEIKGNIDEIFAKKGLSRNYSSMTENEKNTIMLELMHLRDNKEISQEQYQQEIIKLWS